MARIFAKNGLNFFRKIKMPEKWKPYLGYSYLPCESKLENKLNKYTLKYLANIVLQHKSSKKRASSTESSIIIITYLPFPFRFNFSYFNQHWNFINLCRWCFISLGHRCLDIYRYCYIDVCWTIFYPRKSALVGSARFYG